MSGSRIRNAITWSAVENGGLAVLSFVTLILFARYLSPAEFGLFAVVLSIVELGTVLTTMFFHDALIQREQVDDAHYDTAFWVSMAASALFVLGCWIASPSFSSLMEDPDAGDVLLLTALSVPAATLAAVSQARLRRELNLKPLAIRSLVGRIIGAVVGVALVVGGAGIWGMVAQQVLVALVGSVLLLATLRIRYRLRLDMGRLRELTRFGLPAITAFFLTFAIRRVFVIFAGGYLGSAAAGFLNLAFRVVEVLWSLCAVAIGQVALPVLARCQGDAQRIRRAFAQASELSSLAVFLAFGLIGALAPEIIVLLFGERWIEAASATTAMALVVMLQAPRLLISAQLTASGRPALNAVAGGTELLLIAIGFWWLKPEALWIVVVLWAVREAYGTGLVSIFLHRQGTIGVLAQWRPVVPAAVGVGAMMLATWASRKWLLPADWDLWLRLPALGVIATLAYAIGAFAADPGGPSRLWRLARGRGGPELV